MASISSGNILNYDYLLRNCYASNRYVRKGNNRASYSKPELLSADSDALRRISKNLQEIFYEKEDGKNIYNNAKVFVETYNNTIGTAGKIESAELTRNMKKFKKFVNEHKEELESIGIKLASSGKMEIKKEVMLETSAEKIGKVLSGSGKLSGSMEKFAKKINSVSKKIIQEEAAKKSREAAERRAIENQSTSPNSVNYQV